MSTIKSIVTAPLSWFAGHNEFEDTPGKRRRLPVVQSPRDGIEQESRLAKRQRVASPSPEPTQGYLDPPQFIFSSTHKPELRPQGTQSGPFSPVSTNIPSNFLEQRQQQHQQDHLGHHIHSSIQLNSYTQPESLRKEHVEIQVNQHPIAKDAPRVPLPLSREPSALPISRDQSINPTRTPFRMRTTLSPYSSGNEPGPKQQRRERDPSEPPPLTALMSNPIFVKPPPNARPVQRSLSAQPTVTLGTLTQTHRPTRSPSRHASGLLFGLQGSSSGNDPSLRPVNASEIALSELAVYRTPLLPTRLRGASAIPDMFKPKKVHQIVPMRKDKDDMPRLGTTEKKRKKAQKDESSKPYTGQGGMKKLLARRKLEAEAEKEKETSEAMRDDTDSKVAEKSGESAVVDAPVQEPVVQQHRVNGRETSSLRVGRTRISRQHIERPPSTRSVNKFSAVYDEDDSMDMGGDTEESQKLMPIFEAPKGFSFAPETPSAPIPVIVEEVKEPPISALPFSLTKDITPQDPCDKAAFVVPSPAPSQPASFSAPELPSTLGTPPPAIFLSPPTSQPVFRESNLPAPVSTIPNFFANSPLLSKSASAPPTLLTSNLFGRSPIPEKSESAPPKAQFLLDSSATSSAPAPSLFGGVSTSESSSSISVTSALSENATESNPPLPTPLFGKAPDKSADNSFTLSTSLFGVTPPKPLFGPAAVQPLSSSTDGSPFGSFSGSKPSTTAVPPPAADANKVPSLFTTDKNISLPNFGTEVKSEVTKPPPTSEHLPAAPAPVTESSKSTIESGSVSENKDVAKAPFSFGFNALPSNTPAKFSSTTPLTTPAVEKQTSTPFGSISSPAPGPAPVPSSTSLFSFGSSNTTATNNAKTFFGAETPRPTTPKNDQEEVRMEESPTRSMDTNDKNSGSGFFASRNMNFGQSTSSGSSSTPFTFGSSSGSSLFASKPEEKPESKSASSGFSFGSSSSVGFGGFGQKPAEPAQSSFPQSTPFTFGKPESNTQQNSSASPFGFGTQKPLEVNTGSGSQESAGFGFSQRSTSQATSSFGFGPVSPVTATTPQFTFASSNQGTTPSTFGQQNGSAPSSPSTFNQPSPFGFTASAGPSNPFSFQPTTSAATSAQAFSFGQPTASQPQSPAAIFSAPSSPQPGGVPLFTIGAAPTNPTPGARQIKKLPNRRGAKR